MNAWDFTSYFPGISITAVAETSGSWFLFSADQVVKILKPVRRGSIDLSTVAARQKQLKEELDLLNHFNPSLAERVQPLKTGETVSEAALILRRIPRGTNLLARLLTKRVLPGDIKRLGTSLAKAHAKEAAPAKQVDIGDHRALRREVDLALQPLLESTSSMFLSHDTAMRLRDALHQLLERNAAAIQDRLRHKKYRRIHGNLQAGNVYIEETTVSFLDPAKGEGGKVYGDVLADLGCILKDVRAFVPEHADALIRSYLGHAPSAAEEQLLGFYEMLWTIRRFLVHTGELSVGNGGPIDMELVQRYRSFMMRFLAKAPAHTHVPDKKPEQHKRPQQHSAQKPSQKHVQKHEQKHPAQKPTPKKTKKPAPKKAVQKKHVPVQKAVKKPVPKKKAAKKPALKKRAPAKKPAPKKKPTPKKNAAPAKKSVRRGSIGEKLKGFLGMKKPKKRAR